MSVDPVETRIIDGIRDEAYSVPLTLDAAQIHGRLARGPRTLRPTAYLSRIAAVAVLGVAVAGLAYTIAPRPGPSAGSTADACHVSDVIRHEGSWWQEIGGPGAFFDSGPHQFTTDQLSRVLLVVRFDPSPAPGAEIAVWAEHLAGGHRVEASFNSPMDPKNIGRFHLPPPPLPGSWYLFEQALPDAGCWQLTAAIGGEVVGRATIAVADAATRPTIDPNAATPMVAPMPGAPTPETAPTPTVAPFVSGSIPQCDEVPYISAPAHYYRDTPIYVVNEMPTEELRAWAQRKPGFVDLWIDRQHHGWVTLAFTHDAEFRQHELQAEFPGVGVVAVELSRTMEELEALQRRVTESFRSRGVSTSSGIYPNKGVVSIEFGVLKPELVALAEAEFGGDPVCVSGMDPADAPIEGPQPQAGDGWRLLADEDETGGPYHTGIAFDAASYEALWGEIGLKSERPAVDFQTNVVIWFGAVHGSSCPRIRLDDVQVDLERALVFSVVTYLDVGACTDDAIGHAYAVALERSRLPHGPFSIQLDSSDPAGGVLDSRTIVEVDLSAPGAVAQPGQVHPDTSEPEHFLGPGAFIEDGFPNQYRQSTHCGLEWLGPLNRVNWRTEEADGPDWIPPPWIDAITNGTIELRILLTTGPPTIEATANGHSVIYEATADQPPGCD